MRRERGETKGEGGEEGKGGGRMGREEEKKGEGKRRRGKGRYVGRGGRGHMDTGKPLRAKLTREERI